MSLDQLVLVHSLKRMRLNFKILVKVMDVAVEVVMEEAVDVTVAMDAVVVDLCLMKTITVTNNKISPKSEIITIIRKMKKRKFMKKNAIGVIWKVIGHVPVVQLIILLTSIKYH